MITVIVSIVVIIALYLDYKLKPKNGNILPYRIPILGHVYMFFSKDLHKTLEYWADRNNGATFTFQILHKHVVVINDYESIYEALVTKGKATGGRIQTLRTSHVVQNNDIGFGNVSPEWQKLRKVVHTHLRIYGEKLADFQTIALSIGQDMVDDIMGDPACSSYGKAGSH